MSRIKWSRILMSRIEPIARLKSSRQKPATQYWPGVQEHFLNNVATFDLGMPRYRIFIPYIMDNYVMT